MAQRLDKILVVDVEATCWHGGPPPGQAREIIEVGLTLLDVPSLTRGSKTSLLVRPTTSEVSAFCTELTTLTADQVAGGLSFAGACAELAGRHQAADRMWASWGDFDRTLFEDQCRREEVPYPFGPTHLNVKSLFALARGLRAEVGMLKALEQAGVPHEGTHHRGHDDSWNIAALLAGLLGKLRA